MADFPDIIPDDDSSILRANNQVFDSTLTGETQTLNLSGDRWSAQPSFSNRIGLEARQLKAFVFGLGGVSGRFNYSPFDIDQQGTMSGAGVVDGAGQTGSTLKTKGWDYPQTELFQVGDFLSFNGEMKMVTESVETSAIVSYPDAANLMPSPFDPEGWAVSGDPDGAVTNVTMDNPSGEAFVGLIEQVGGSELNLCNNFSNQYLSSRGEQQATAMIYRLTGPAWDQGLQVALFSNAGIQDFALFDIAGKGIVSGEFDYYRFTDLGDDYVLIETKTEALQDVSSVYSSHIIKDTGGNAAPVGSQLYAQSVFSGKNPLEYPYALYNEFEDAAEAGEWSPTNVNITASGGLLSFVATADDPLMTNSVSFDGSKYTEVKIRWRRNDSTTLSNRFFWDNGTGLSGLGFGENVAEPRQTTTGPDGNGFFETTIDMSTTEGWTDFNVTLIRLDFGQLLPADFDIDYIKIYSPSLLTAYEEWWPSSIDGVADIPIAPKIRVSPADNNAIEVVKPYFIARLEDDDQARTSVSAPIVYNATFSIVEAF